MVTRNAEPQLIEPDYGTFRHGTLDILVHWDIEEIQAETPDGQTYSQWTYSEARISWTLPHPYSTRGDIQAYLDSIYDVGDLETGQILSWAKSSIVNNSLTEGVYVAIDPVISKQEQIDTLTEQLSAANAVIFDIIMGA